MSIQGNGLRIMALNQETHRLTQEALEAAEPERSDLLMDALLVRAAQIRLMENA